MSLLHLYFLVSSVLLVFCHAVTLRCPGNVTAWFQRNTFDARILYAELDIATTTTSTGVVSLTVLYLVNELYK